MLTSIAVRNVIGTVTATLPITMPTADDRYQIEKITGLDPVKATINTSPYALQDGGFYQSSKGGERNIVITMKSVPRYASEAPRTIESLRQEAYSIFPPKAFVRLGFFTHLRPAFPEVEDPEYEIVGYVESLESELFEKDPKITISIVCPKPNFAKPRRVSLKNRVSSTDVEFPYTGSADVGFILTLSIQSTLQSLIVYNSGVSEPLRLDFPTLPPVNRLIAGDIVEISTLPGAKRVRVNRNGVDINALENITSGSMSMILGPAVKTFRVDAIPVAGQSSVVEYSIDCWPAYVGL